MTLEQATDVVCKFLQDKSHKPKPLDALQHALSGAWPCK
ncbi:hypothetical protein [Rhizobium acidisoli]